eukprot:5432185-Heterocapsa_arctica.AAC.1
MPRADGNSQLRSGRRKKDKDQDLPAFMGVGSTQKAQHICSKGMANSNEHGWGAAAPHAPRTS